MTQIFKAPLQQSGATAIAKFQPPGLFELQGVILPPDAYLHYVTVGTIVQVAFKKCDLCDPRQMISVAARCKVTLPPGAEVELLGVIIGAQPGTPAWTASSTSSIAQACPTERKEHLRALGAALRMGDIEKMWDRLQSFIDLPTDWAEGSGPVNAELVTRVQGVLARLLVEYPVTPPSVFPTPEGGIQTEWVTPDWAIDLCFESDGKVHAEATHRRDEQGEALFKSNIVDIDVFDLGDWLNPYFSPR